MSQNHTLTYTSWTESFALQHMNVKTALRCTYSAHTSSCTVKLKERNGNNNQNTFFGVEGDFKVLLVRNNFLYQIWHVWGRHNQKTFPNKAGELKGVLIHYSPFFKRDTATKVMKYSHGVLQCRRTIWGQPTIAFQLIKGQKCGAVHNETKVQRCVQVGIVVIFQGV